MSAINNTNEIRALSNAELDDIAGGLTKGEVAAIAVAVVTPVGAAVAVGAAGVAYAAYQAAWYLLG